MMRIDELFRARLYNDFKILVNDINPCVKVIKILLDELISANKTADIKEILDIDGVAEIHISEGNLEWFLCSNQIYDIKVKKFTIENINEIIDIDKFNEVLKEKGIEDYPKELYGGALYSLVKVIERLINVDELIEETDIFEICKIGNNGSNNVII